jgi:ABC-type Na+ efflux pump permease subunit
MTSPILLNAVVEEKMQRIAEVLLASVSAGQLLGGKLLAGVGAGLTFAAVYLISLALSLAFLNAAHWVPPAAYAWFFPFLLCGLLTFGSIFAAFSAASQDLKDTQNFAGAVALFLVVPLMLTIALMEAPDGPVARTLSFIPPISPLLMIMRVAVPPGPAAWEPWLAWILGLMFAVVVIWLAGRIFRIGILSHGRTPGWRDILRWAFRE